MRHGVAEPYVILGAILYFAGGAAIRSLAARRKAPLDDLEADRRRRAALGRQDDLD